MSYEGWLVCGLFAFLALGGAVPNILLWRSANREAKEIRGRSG